MIHRIVRPPPSGVFAGRFASVGGVSWSPRPLPASVYWRRRVVAVGGAALALVAAVWGAGAVLGRTAPQGAPVATTSTSSPPPLAEGLVLAEAGAASAGSTTGSPAPPSGQPSAGAADGTPPGSAEPPPPPQPPPGPPQPCADAAVLVRAVLGKEQHAVGEHADFRIAVTNTGQLPCTREIGRGVRELVVTSPDGATRLWSSNDCLAAEGSEVRVMKPGEVFEFGLKWPGTTSAPGCGPRTRLGAGDYLLVARVGDRSSDPAVFRIG
ncbi:hypothetical protein CNX65_01770 [Actinosynnema pretiosum]|uniref:Uncharacterized protein n=1 Tax=Actinosynnema pretiosum TaxID=42197 RepID=A0A290YZK0_9PSEU|nr:hypothetical protein CNX65_01770 [Actinosynnema pretiosum]